jgi:hypothetical protein
MHQTTVRFGSRLWADLEFEAALEGVSVAQFVREAAVARLSAIAGQRPPGPSVALHAEAARSQAARAEASESGHESEAVWSQSRQARQRAADLREQAEEIRTHTQMAQARAPKSRR